MVASKSAIRSVLKRKTKKLGKALPRGTAFQKGNTLGHRWKKGESGNPGGRPAFKEIGEAVRSALGAERSPIPRTNAEKIAEAWIKKAKQGNVGALQSLANRAEGLPFQSIGVTQGPDPLIQLLEIMRERHTEKFGSDEQPLLEANTDDDGEGEPS
jgi:hypothetical protein